MVAQGGVKLDACVQHRLIGIFEFSAKVCRGIAAVNVVTHHQHKIERKLRALADHLLGYFVLLRAAGSVVSEHCKAHRLRL